MQSRYVGVCLNDIRIYRCNYETYNRSKTVCPKCGHALHWRSVGARHKINNSRPVTDRPGMEYRFGG